MGIRWMRRRRDPDRRRRLRNIIIVCALLASAGGLVLLSRAGLVSLPFLEKIPEYTIVPVQRLIGRIGTWFESRFSDKTALEDEIFALREQVNRLTLENQALTEEKAENERLRALLDFAETSEQTYLVSDVIAMSPGNWFSTFTIDKGANQGVAVDMAVLTAQGLVGRVTEVADTYSVVRSIIDSRSAVSGMIERTRDNVIIKGSLLEADDSTLLQLAYVGAGIELVIGDRVLTSGLDGIFPKGLLVGSVKTISRQSYDGEYAVTVTPAADFKRLEEVLVLMDGSVTGQ